VLTKKEKENETVAVTQTYEVFELLLLQTFTKLIAYTIFEVLHPSVNSF